MKKIYKVRDNDIFGYLNSRNSKFNRVKMIKTKPIDYIDHFIWWFTNKREIFFYKLNKKKKIYFYQEVIKYQKKKYLIGGWHSNSNQIDIMHVLYFLKLKFKNNKKRKLNYDWIAVVKKNNPWILKLTKYLGYTKVQKGELHYRVIKNYFCVDEKRFYFLKLKL